MLEIYVDADACPVKDEVFRVAERHGLAVHVVANQWLRLPRVDWLRMVLVSEGLDAADDWIAGHIGAGDICVTADILLAARCLALNARALGPTGKAFTEDNIGTAVAMRELSQQLRDSGEISGHNPGFTRADRSRFLQALEAAVQDVLRDS